MDVAYLSTLFRYNHWANDQIILLVGMLPEPDDVLMTTIGHIFAAGDVWHERLHNNEVAPVEMWPNLLHSECNDLNEKELDRFLEYLTVLEESDLKKEIRYKNLKGISYTNSVMEVLGHIVNHATHHRAQILSRLKDLGATTLNLDFISYARRH